MVTEYIASRYRTLRLLRQGERSTVRLIDFDAARFLRETGERDTALLGTVGYAPPEQYGFSQTDARSDIYALGRTFQRLLPHASGSLARILARCTALDPARRYPTDAALLRDLRHPHLRRGLTLGAALLLALAALLAARGGAAPRYEPQSGGHTGGERDSPEAPGSEPVTDGDPHSGRRPRRHPECTSTRPAGTRRGEHWQRGGPGDPDAIHRRTHPQCGHYRLLPLGWRAKYSGERHHPPG